MAPHFEDEVFAEDDLQDRSGEGDDSLPENGIKTRIASWLADIPSPKPRTFGCRPLVLASPSRRQDSLAFSAVPLSEPDVPPITNDTPQRPPARDVFRKEARDPENDIDCRTERILFCCGRRRKIRTGCARESEWEDGAGHDEDQLMKPRKVAISASAPNISITVLSPPPSYWHLEPLHLILSCCSSSQVWLLVAASLVCAFAAPQLAFILGFALLWSRLVENKLRDGRGQTASEATHGSESLGSEEDLDLLKRTVSGALGLAC